MLKRVTSAVIFLALEGDCNAFVQNLVHLSRHEILIAILLGELELGN